MIITGKIKNAGDLSKIFFQVFYKRYDKLTDPQKLQTTKDGKFLNIYNFNTQDKNQLGNLPALPNDEIILFFWEGKEDKSEIDKLTALNYNLTKDFVQKIDIPLMDFSKAIDIKLEDEDGKELTEITAFKNETFNFSKFVIYKTNFTFRKEGDKVFYQYLDTLKFFNWKNYIKFSLKINDEEKKDPIKFDTLGIFNATGNVSVFQFSKAFTLKVTVVEAPPKYTLTTDPEIPIVGESAKINIKIEENLKIKKKLEIFEDDRVLAVKDIATTGIPDDFSLTTILTPAFYHNIILKYTYFNGFEDYTDVQTFKIFMKNIPPLLQISNKEAVSTAGGDTREVNLYLKSKNVKRVNVNWYLKIKENPEWIFLCKIPLLELKNWSEIDDIRKVDVKVISATGLLKMELELEDMFEDKSTDSVTFENNCNKFDVKNIDLLHSNILQ